MARNSYGGPIVPCHPGEAVQSGGVTVLLVGVRRGKGYLQVQVPPGTEVFKLDETQRAKTPVARRGGKGA